MEGSEVRYSDDFGAMLVEASDSHLTFHFITRTATVIDSYTITTGAPLPAVSITATDAFAAETGNDTGTLTVSRTDDTSADLAVAYTVDTASSFTNTVEDISSRTRTTASAAWSPLAWTTVGEAGPDQRTPDITSVIQEIVDRPGWSSGNALVVIISGSGERAAESYNGDPAGAPLLHVEYRTAPPQPRSLVTWTGTVRSISTTSTTLSRG